MGYVLLGAALVCNALANFLLKLGSSNFAAVREVGLIRGVFTNYVLLGGLALFACNIVFYALALSKIPLSVGYPIMTAGGLIILTTISALYLREAMGLWQVLGIGLIIVGIVCVMQK
ncbi:MAG: SMR family transporter [bacterium]